MQVRKQHCELDMEKWTGSKLRKESVKAGCILSPCLFNLYTECVLECACSVSSVVFNSLLPYGLQLTRLLCPWDSAGRNTGVGCHFPPDPGIKPGSPAVQADSLPTELQGKFRDSGRKK